jgi:hypothetical protein
VDFSGFLSGLIGNVVAGAVVGLLVLYVGYRFVERRLRLEERGERAREAEAQRKQNLEAVLQAVHDELESNAAQLTTALKELPTGGIPYPLFDLTFWPLVSAPVIFTTLKCETIQALTHTYNRMATANEQNAFLSDLNHGPTAILASTGAAPALEDERVRDAYHRFLEHRDEVRLGVIERLTELKLHLDDAIDAVEAELGLAVEHQAAKRIYQPDAPVGFIGDPL